MISTRRENLLGFALMVFSGALASPTPCYAQRIEQIQVLGRIVTQGSPGDIAAPCRGKVLRLVARERSSEFLNEIHGRVITVDDVMSSVVQIERQKLGTRVDPFRVYPLIGPAQKVHTDYRYLFELKDGSQEVFMVDHHHLHAQSPKE